MPHLPVSPLTLILVFALAGLVKGVIGMGLPTVGVGLLSLAMPPAEAAALIVVPSLVTNLWQALSGGALRMLLRRLWPVLLGICAGTFLAAATLPGLRAGGEAHAAFAALGAALVLYALLGLSPLPLPDVKLRTEKWLGPLAGAATGAVSTATGVFVLPAVPYLQALGLGRAELVQALGLAFTTATVALAAALAGHGVLGAGNAGASLLALAPALLGMRAGQHLRRLASQAAFRRCFFLGILLLGADLLARGLV